MNTFRFAVLQPALKLSNACGGVRYAFRSSAFILQQNRVQVSLSNIDAKNVHDTSRSKSYPR